MNVISRMLEQELEKISEMAVNEEDKLSRNYMILVQRQADIAEALSDYECALSYRNDVLISKEHLELSKRQTDAIEKSGFNINVYKLLHE